MNLRSSLRLNTFLVSLGTGAALVACGGPVSSTSTRSEKAQTEGTTASGSLALDTADFGDAPGALAAPLTAIGACTIARDGTRTDQDDLCAGSGSSRILVTFRDGSTCAGALGVPIGGVTPEGQTKSYLFSSAPAIVKERYCVLAGGTSLGSDAEAERVVRSLCASPEVAAVTRDCSGHAVPASAAPGNDGAAKRGAPASALAAPPSSGDSATATTNGDDSANPRIPCDVCGMVAAASLYVSLPTSFVAPVANTPMVVRFSAASVSDLVVYPPALTQSFVVGGVTAPAGTDVTIYPPGAVPDPKPQ